ncbi:hypothetical protein M569_15148 [Genlisea aurea]|uniref:Uncharacterized protein n=1 Tax=Genlisea aurea TaxID=192259 RepID=S8DAD8_9LAMI|nr:hypothetical protein M569_15148 [Genlisea aurea]
MALFLSFSTLKSRDPKCCGVCTMILPEGTNNLQQHESSHFAKKSGKNTNAACIPDVDIEKGKSDVPKTAEERRTDSTVKYRTSEVYIPRSVEWSVGFRWLNIVLKYFLKPNSSNVYLLMFRKGTSPVERAHDTSSNRSRKYRRSSSFNSRRVILLSSILSIAGTIILIYLTLRVRQTNQ